jgi:hypothetical protein
LLVCTVYSVLYSELAISRKPFAKASDCKQLHLSHRCGELLPPLALQPNSGLGRLHETFRFTSVTKSRTVGRTPWTGDQLVARPLPVHKHRKNAHTTQTLNIHAQSGIRTHGPGVGARKGSSCLRPLSYRDRRCGELTALIIRAVCSR